MKIRHKLARWFGFTVLIALVPLVAAFFGLRAYARYQGLVTITAHGELLLIASAIGSSAVGELIPPKTKRYTVAKIVVGSLILFLVLICSMYFALIMLGFGSISASVVSFDSTFLLLCMVVLSGLGIALSEV